MISAFQTACIATNTLLLVSIGFASAFALVTGVVGWLAEPVVKFVWGVG